MNKIIDGDCYDICNNNCDCENCNIPDEPLELNNDKFIDEE